MKISNFRLGLGFPLSFPLVHSDFFFSMMMIERPEFIVLRSENGPIDAMRNDLVEQAQRARCSHLMMMDSDHVYHPKTITNLLSCKLPVVGALVYRRYPPFDPLLLSGDPVNGYKSIDVWESNQLVEVDATGTGCLMFDMKIFQKLPLPWFRFREHPVRTDEGIGEDIGFCWDLRVAGYKIFVDTSVPSDHLTTLRVNDALYRMYKTMKTQQRDKALTKALFNKDINTGAK